MKLKFSILVPLYNTPDRFLREMIESVKRQTYRDWELCLADASDREHAKVGEIVHEYAETDNRIRYTKLKENKGISENTNACIELSTGNYFALLDHDDVLDEKALKEAAWVIKKKHADFVYTDEAKFTNSTKEWYAPNYKPDFSKYELRAHNYICHLTIYSRELLEKVGRYRKEFDGSQDHDMVLRLTENAKQIAHIPKILYYWRVHEESVSAGVEKKTYAVDAGRKAVLEQVVRCGGRGEVVSYEPFLLLYHVLYEIQGNPCVSVVLYGEGNAKELVQCVEFLEIHSGYKNFEYLIFAERDQSQFYQESLERMSDIHPYRLLELSWNPKDEERINQLLNEYGKEYLLFLNVSTKVAEGNFIRELLMLCQQKDVGVVGPKIYTDHDTIKNAGLALTKAAEGGIVYRFENEAADSVGHEAQLCHIREVTALTEECMMISRQVFVQCNGFSGHWESYRGIDLCLRAREQGYRNVWTPYAGVVGLTERQKHKGEEAGRFEKKWGKFFSVEDPYYNRSIRYDIDNIHDNNTVFLLAAKSLSYLREEGFSGLLNRMNVYKGVGGQHSHTSTHVATEQHQSRKRAYKDILLISGYRQSELLWMENPAAYHREQLEACNQTTDEVYYKELDSHIVKYYKSIMFVDCPYTDMIERTIRQAREWDRLVLFDICYRLIDNDIRQILPLCDGAIIATESLAAEFSPYISDVCIHPVAATERQYELAEQAVFERDVLPFLPEDSLPEGVTNAEYQIAVKQNHRRDRQKVSLGCICIGKDAGEAFGRLGAVLAGIMKEFSQTELYLFGEVKLPESLNAYQERIRIESNIALEKLPVWLASMAINLVPGTMSVSDKTRIEEVWLQAALVKIPTVMADTGDFAAAIRNHGAGVPCSSGEGWYRELKHLITDGEKRMQIADAAYDFAHKNYLSLYTGKRLRDYIEYKRKPNLAVALSTEDADEKMHAALRFAVRMKKQGYAVWMINGENKTQDLTFEGSVFPVLSAKDTDFYGRIDNCVSVTANMIWFPLKGACIQNKYYLVERHETESYKPNDPRRIEVERTYHLDPEIRYLTDSEECAEWLRDRYGISATRISEKLAES